LLPRKLLPRQKHLLPIPFLRLQALNERGAVLLLLLRSSASSNALQTAALNTSNALNFKRLHIISSRAPPQQNFSITLN
jgi:hypothetical protein